MMKIRTPIDTLEAGIPSPRVEPELIAEAECPEPKS